MIPESPKRKRVEDTTHDETNSINSAPSSPSSFGDEKIPSHISDRENVERFRIDSLMYLEQEREMNEVRRRELDVLANFTTSTVRTSFVADQEHDHDDNRVVREILEGGNEMVKLMVRNKLFITTLSTINKRENMLKTMLGSGLGVDKENDAIVLDLNPDYFPIILEHLRTGSTNYIGLWEEASESALRHLKELLNDSDFFGTRKLSARVAMLIRDYSQKLNQQTNQMQQGMQQPTIPTKIKTHDTTMHADQEQEDEKWLAKFANLTIQEKKILETYVEEKKGELTREQQDLKEKEAKYQKDPITFNTRGTKFTISMEKLLIQKDSIFPSLLYGLKKNEEIFLDRDSEIFGHIFEYLQNGSTCNIPKDVPKRKLIYKEAKEFKIYALMNYLDPLRFPIEDIGSSNLKIKQEEDFIRKLFVTDRLNPILNDPYLHLVNVFGNENTSRKMFQHSAPTVPLLFDFENSVEASELVHEYSRLQVPEKPKICKSREVFFTQFNAFTGGLFKNMNWDNMFCAGGGILACMLEAPIASSPTMQPIEPKKTTTRISWDQDDDDYQSGSDLSEKLEKEGYLTASSDEDSTNNPHFGYNTFHRRKFRNWNSTTTYKSLTDYYRNSPQWENSDIDLFIYNTDEKQAEEKIVNLYNLFKKNSDDEDILMIRTQHAITFRVSCYPSVQIILRIYKSPAEILSSFDIPCCCVGFDGNQLYCLPRAAVAISTRCNLVDPDRQSTTYELRLVKYALRGFRIGVAGYSEKKIANQVLFDRDYLYYPRRFSTTRQKKRADVKQVTGLARILLTLHAFKNNRRRNGVFASMGGSSNLKKTIDMLEPSKEHDYAQVPVKWGDVPLLYKQLQSVAKLMELKSNKKPYFEVALNDIGEITNTKTPISNLTPHIEWLTIQPGTQSVGSFHPHTRNFFIDAYANPKEIKKQKCKYQWSYSSRANMQNNQNYTFDEETSVTIEKRYREYLRDRHNIEARKYEPIKGHIIHFSNMALLKPLLNQNSGRISSQGTWFSVQRKKLDSKIVKRRMKLEEYYPDENIGETNERVEDVMDSESD